MQFKVIASIILFAISALLVKVTALPNQLLYLFFILIVVFSFLVSFAVIHSANCLSVFFIIVACLTLAFDIDQNPPIFIKLLFIFILEIIICHLFF